MSTRNLRLSFFGALLATFAGAGILLAQREGPPPARREAPPAGQRQAAPPAEEGAPQQEPQAFRAKQVIGSKVNIQGDMAVGTVEDIVLDEHGNVDYLIVANQDGQMVTVPWDAVRFNLDKRLAIVHIAPDQFQAVPTYTAQQYPAFAAPAYRTQIYRAYGLTPGQQRRAMRRGGFVR
jgi:hypothetical protein